YPALYVLTESCEVHTRDGRTYTGTFQPVNPAVHVNTKLADFKPTEENTEIVLDLPVSSAEEVAGYGIRAGDIISLDPRTTVSGGFIKSRHLDDKASAGVLLSLAALVADGEIELGRRVHLLFTTYEEVGHGGSAGIPADTEEMISVDMGAVGDDLLATEHQVSICAKDSGGPYDYAVTSALIDAAEQSGASYSVDIYPRYGSDVEATLRAGFDIRHGLIGPGVSASHGYERTHRDGVEATLALLAHYVSQRGREA
ncbi:MAG: peptidase M42, partial [Spirochaetota bacterium]